MIALLRLDNLINDNLVIDLITDHFDNVIYCTHKPLDNSTLNNFVGKDTWMLASKYHVLISPDKEEVAKFNEFEGLGIHINNYDKLKKMLESL